jgi:uncharacterized OB-fold protein
MAETRPLPRLTALTRPFWTSGQDGRLRFQRCEACGLYVHPPGPVCPRCLCREVRFAPVAGTGTVLACTLNHHAWYPGWETPYVVAIVELDEQDGLRLVTNIVDCDPHSVRIGVRVEVCFEHRDEVWLPLFRPVGNP